MKFSRQRVVLSDSKDFREEAKLMKCIACWWEGQEEDCVRMIENCELEESGPCCPVCLSGVYEDDEQISYEEWNERFTAFATKRNLI